MWGVFVHHTVIVNKGNNNAIYIGEGCRISHCKIQCFGDNCTVQIERDCVCGGLTIWVSDGGTVLIGHNTHFTNDVHLACIEGKSITIGDRCLFSNDVTFRTGDSHVITDLDDNRLNESKDICIGNHVWIGNQIVVLKGSSVGDDSIVGTRSLLTGKDYGANSIIAGAPAKVIRENVNWRPE